MYSNSPQSYIRGGSIGLLVSGDLLQIIQCLPTIYHPATHTHTHSQDYFFLLYKATLLNQYNIIIETTR